MERVILRSAEKANICPVRTQGAIDHHPVLSAVVVGLREDELQLVGAVFAEHSIVSVEHAHDVGCRSAGADFLVLDADIAATDYGIRLPAGEWGAIFVVTDTFDPFLALYPEWGVKVVLREALELGVRKQIRNAGLGSSAVHTSAQTDNSRPMAGSCKL